MSEAPKFSPHAGEQGLNWSQNESGLFVPEQTDTRRSNEASLNGGENLEDMSSPSLDMKSAMDEIQAQFDELSSDDRLLGSGEAREKRNNLAELSSQLEDIKSDWLKFGGAEVDSTREVYSQRETELNNFRAANPGAEIPELIEQMIDNASDNYKRAKEAFDTNYRAATEGEVESSDEALTASPEVTTGDGVSVEAAADPGVRTEVSEPAEASTSAEESSEILVNGISSADRSAAHEALSGVVDNADRVAVLARLFPEGHPLHDVSGYSASEMRKLVGGLNNEFVSKPGRKVYDEAVDAVQRQIDADNPYKNNSEIVEDPVSQAVAHFEEVFKGMNADDRKAFLKTMGLTQTTNSAPSSQNLATEAKQANPESQKSWLGGALDRLKKVFNRNRTEKQALVEASPTRKKTHSSLGRKAILSAVGIGVAFATPFAAISPAGAEGSATQPAVTSVESDFVGRQAQSDIEQTQRENAERASGADAARYEAQRTEYIESLRMDRETANEVIKKFEGKWHNEASLAAGFNGDVRTEQGMKDFREYLKAHINVDNMIAAQFEAGDMDIAKMNKILDDMNASPEYRQEVVDRNLKEVNEAPAVSITDIGKSGSRYMSTYDQQGKLGVAASGYDAVMTTFEFSNGKHIKVSDGCLQLVGDSVVPQKVERTVPKNTMHVHVAPTAKAPAIIKAKVQPGKVIDFVSTEKDKYVPPTPEKTPVKPTEQTPETPNIPDTPVTPDIPDTPVTPDIPDTPVKPDIPDKPTPEPEVKGPTHDDEAAHGAGDKRSELSKPANELTEDEKKPAAPAVTDKPGSAGGKIGVRGETDDAKTVIATNAESPNNSDHKETVQNAKPAGTENSSGASASGVVTDAGDM